MKELPCVDTLEKFDCIVIHYIFRCFETYIPEVSRENPKIHRIEDFVYSNEYRRVDLCATRSNIPE